MSPKKVRLRLVTIYRSLLAFLASSLFLRLIVVWFVVQSVWMAISTQLGVSPDETYHYNFIKLFAHNGWLPFIHDQSGYYFLGEVARTPFILYHYLLSLPYHLLDNSQHSLLVLRLMNVALGVATFYLANKLAIKLKVSALAKNLSLFMLANTLMFVFLSGAINYDNLLIPLILATVILSIDLFDKITVTRLLLLAITVLAGSLIALNFLPIILFAGATVAIVLWREKNILRRLLRSWHGNRTVNMCLLLPLVLLLALFSQRYLLNLVQYHDYAPACGRINTVEQCNQNGVYRRAATVKKNAKPTQISPVEYSAQWSLIMNADIFGILGHKSIAPNRLIRLWSELLMVGGTLIIARYYRLEKRWNLLLGAALFYVFMLFIHNYLNYERIGMNLGVQGRYLFPFLPVFYFLINKYVLDNFREPIRAAYIIITVLVFMTASLPTYITKTSPDWYTRPGMRLNADFKQRLEKIH